MYRKKDDLKDLIKSLSMSEKRYFTRFLTAISPDRKKSPLYFTLFYQIEKSTYSDAYRQEPKRARTHAAKRLYDNILKGLLLYHHERSADIIIQNLIIQIEILYYLSLPNQCIPLLKRAYKMAHLHENFGLLLHVLQWERRISIIMEHPPRSIEHIAEEEQEVLAKLSQITNLESICSKTIEFRKQLGYIDSHEALESITIKSPMMPTLDECKTQKAIFYYDHIHTLYYTTIYEPARAYEHSKRLTSSPIQSILPNDYIDGLLSHVISCLSLGYFDEALNILQKLDVYMHDQKIDQSDSFKVLIFYYKICAHLIIYNYIGNKERLSETIRVAEEHLTIYDKKFSAKMKQVILGNLCNAYVGIGDIDSAINIMEWLFRKESKLVRKEIYNDLYLFRLFSSLQEKMYVLLPSMALSAFRYFKNQKNSEVHFKVELEITSLLLKEHDYENVKKMHAVLLGIRNLLAKHIAQLKGVRHFQEHYSFYIIWAESMLYGRPFYKQAKIWYKQHKSLGNKK